MREARGWIAELGANEKPPPVAVIDAAVLFESGLARLADAVVVVVASEQVQAERIAVRDSISTEQALARVRAQRPIEEMLKRADFVIRTDCSLEQVEAQVDRVVANAGIGRSHSGWGATALSASVRRMMKLVSTAYGCSRSW